MRARTYAEAIAVVLVKERGLKLSGEVRRSIPVTGRDSPHHQWRGQRHPTYSNDVYARSAHHNFEIIVIRDYCEGHAGSSIDPCPKESQRNRVLSVRSGIPWENQDRTPFLKVRAAHSLLVRGCYLVARE